MLSRYYRQKVSVCTIHLKAQGKTLLAAGGLGRLQRLVDGQLGNQWADPDKALGRFLYSTYTEEDYNVIWENYMYIGQDNWWVEYDFGKKNCSEAGPRRADVPGRLEDVWVDRVGTLTPLVCEAVLRAEHLLQSTSFQIMPFVSVLTVHDSVSDISASCTKADTLQHVAF